MHIARALTPRIWITAILIASLVAAVTVAVDSSPARAATTWEPLTSSYNYDPSPKACTNVLFVGVRGSGEPDKEADSPLGPTETKVRDALEAQTTSTDANLTVRQVYVDYDSAGLPVLGRDLIRNLQALALGQPQNAKVWNYFDSIRQGVTLLGRLLAQSRATCPNQKWILSGYSQGALVVSAVATLYKNPSNYDGVLLVGDPANSPTRAVIHQGTAPSTARGIYDLAFGPDAVPLPISLAGSVYSYCNYEDIVCDTNDAFAGAVADLQSTPPKLRKAMQDGGAEFTAGAKVHSSYATTALTQAVAPIAKVLNATAPTPTPTPTPTAADYIAIPDATLKQCVLSAYKSLTGVSIAEITAAQMASLTRLGCYAPNDLTGLKYATGIKNLELSQLGWNGQPITHLGEIAGLKQLTTLTLPYGISDASPLSALSNLTSLTVGGTLNSIVPIESLTKLKGLVVDGDISSVSGLSKMPDLTDVVIRTSSLVNDVASLQPLLARASVNILPTVSEPSVKVGSITSLPAIIGLDGAKIQPVLDPSYAAKGTFSPDGSSITWIAGSLGAVAPVEWTEVDLPTNSSYVVTYIFESVG